MPVSTFDILRISQIRCNSKLLFVWTILLNSAFSSSYSAPDRKAEKVGYRLVENVVIRFVQSIGMSQKIHLRLYIIGNHVAEVIVNVFYKQTEGCFVDKAINQHVRFVYLFVESRSLLFRHFEFFLLLYRLGNILTHNDKLFIPVGSRSCDLGCITSNRLVVPYHILRKRIGAIAGHARHRVWTCRCRETRKDRNRFSP